MHKNGYISPRVYFSYGFFYGDQINPALLGKFARSTANVFLNHKTPIPLLEYAYIELYNIFDRERAYNDIEDISDIMRAEINSEPYSNFNFLMEFIDCGLLAVECDDDIEAFFLHFHKVIDLCKYSNLEGVVEY